MATFLGLSDWLEQELIDALYHDYVRDGHRPTKVELRARLESLIKRLDECSVYEDKIVRATGSSEPYTCNAYPSKLVEQTSHQAGVALLRLVLQAIRENVRGELTPMMWVDQETGEPIREKEVLGEVNPDRSEPVRPNVVLRPMRVDRVEVDRLILAIRRERELVRWSINEADEIKLDLQREVPNAEQASGSATLSEDGEQVAVMSDDQPPPFGESRFPNQKNDQPGFLDLIVDESRGEVRRDGEKYKYLFVSFGVKSSEWHTFYVAWKSEENGATQDQWANGYPGSTAPDAMRSMKRNVNDKIKILDIRLKDREPPWLIDSAST